MESKYLKHLSKYDIIHETIIGSHMWKMNHGKSDVDYFRIYKEPLNKILNGTATYKSHNYDEISGKTGVITGKVKIDIVEHEVGHVINQLLKGNMNFVIGVMSPKRMRSGKGMLELISIIGSEPTKNLYHSVRGMAEGNYAKYILCEGDVSEKKCNQIIRNIEFCIRVLNGEGFKFLPVKGYTKDDVKPKIVELEKVYNDSDLPEEPDEGLYRRWLLRERLM